MSRFIFHIAGVLLLIKCCVGGAPILWETPANSGSCGNIDENVQPGPISTVMVNATSTSDQIANYTVSNPSNDVIFSFDQTGHGMLVSGSIDYETVTSLTFVVTATDDAGASSTVTCTVMVNDVNDNAPMFGNVETPVTIANGTAANTRVTTVTATDADGSSPNNQVTYSITAGNTGTDLAIVEATGVINAAKELDMARTQEYMLTITAMDGGTPMMSSTTKLTVCVGSCDSGNTAPGMTFSLVCLLVSLLLALNA